jgi:hypothetical protein
MSCRPYAISSLVLSERETCRNTSRWKANIYDVKWADVRGEEMNASKSSFRFTRHLRG